MAKQIEIVFERGGKFIATLLEEKAPKTCEAMWKTLPIEGKAFHCKWAGRGIYVNVKAQKVPKENQTSHVADGYLGYYHDWDELFGWKDIDGIDMYYAPELVRTDVGPIQINYFARIKFEQLEEFEKVGRRIHENGPEKVSIERVKG